MSMNTGTSPKNEWNTVDQDFKDHLPEIVARLNRKQYTPEPPYKGVCGFPIPSGLLATLQYRCQCGSIRCKVLAVVVGAHLPHEKVFCLKCGRGDLIFECLDIGAV